jgi:hypothetical protein
MKDAAKACRDSASVPGEIALEMMLSHSEKN